MPRETNSERLVRIEEKVSNIELLIHQLQKEDDRMHSRIYKWMMILTVIVLGSNGKEVSDIVALFAGGM